MRETGVRNENIMTENEEVTYLFHIDAEPAGRYKRPRDLRLFGGVWFKEAAVPPKLGQAWKW